MDKPKKPPSKPPSEGDAQLEDPPPPGGYAPAAAFDDTLANNRSCPVVDAAKVPHAPASYRPTNPEIRARNLRKLPGDLRSAAKDALIEATNHEDTFRDELGPYAPDFKVAVSLLTRLTETGALVAATRSLLGYAREVDQIATSDVVLFLEAANKQLNNGMEHNGRLGESYPALVALFASRSATMKEGQVRAKRTKKAEAAKQAEAAKGTEPTK